MTEKKVAAKAAPSKTREKKKAGAAPIKKTAAARKPKPGFVAEVLDFFNEYYPEAQCSLSFGSPFQLLAATILSAQCTDERVNKTTPALFDRYPDAAAMAQANPEDLEKIIKPCGFYHNKAKSLLAASQTIMNQHGGQVPQTLEQLVALPGVGRKTANVVLGNAFGVPGLTVDTHLGRLSRRLGFTTNQDPEKVEADLAAIIPQAKWTIFSHQAIHHGRALCRARNPLCDQCPLKNCPRIGV